MPPYHSIFKLEGTFQKRIISLSRLSAINIASEWHITLIFTLRLPIKTPPASLPLYPIKYFPFGTYMRPPLEKITLNLSVTSERPFFSL
jgi:hypothetical protein